jgi:replicative DNA helicase
MTTIPASLDAEKAFLSCAIQNISILNEAADYASPKLFHHPCHKRVFESALELWKEGKDCDLVTLTDAMSNAGTLDDSGGAAFLTECFMSPCVQSNWREYLEILRHKHTARLAISAAERIIASAQNPAEAGELSEVVQKALVSVAADAETTSKIESIKESAMNRVNEYEQMVANKGKLMGLTYGIKPLDDHTGGMREGQLIVVGGATKSGKTALSLNIAQRTADAGNNVGFFSLEMSSGELVDRMVASYAGVDISVLGKDPTKQDMDKIRFGIGQISKLPIWIRDESSINPLQIMAAARRIVAAHQVKVLFLDYIQLVSPLNTKDSRERQIAEVSRCLKLIAKELKICVVALTQLNSDGASRESRAIEHDADLMLVLRHDEENGSFLDIKLGRNCSRASFPMEFRANYLRFDSRS